MRILGAGYQEQKWQEPCKSFCVTATVLKMIAQALTGHDNKMTHCQLSALDQLQIFSQCSYQCFDFLAKNFLPLLLQ